MKIAYFVHCYPPAKGGLEYLSGEIVDILRKAGHEVHVFTGKGETLDSYKTFDNWVDESQDTDYIHRLPLRFFWQKLANKFLNKLIFVTGFFSPWYFGPILEYSQQDKEVIADCDLVFGAGMPTKMFYDSYRFAKKYKKRLIVLPAYHNVTYYKNVYVYQKAINYANKIVILSDYEKRYLADSYRINKEKIVKLTYSPFSKKEIEESLINNLSRIYNLNRKVTIGFVGQITTRKNLKTLIKIAKKLHSSNDLNKLILAGIKTNSSEVIEAMLIESDINYELNYNFKELKKEKIYKKIDVFINPSIEESFGIATLEAMKYGCIAITRFKLEDLDTLSFSNVEEAYRIITKLKDKDIVTKCLNIQYQLLKKYNKEAFKEILLKKVI